MLRSCGSEDEGGHGKPKGRYPPYYDTRHEMNSAVGKGKGMLKSSTVDRCSLENSPRPARAESHSRSPFSPRTTHVCVISKATNAGSTRWTLRCAENRPCRSDTRLTFLGIAKKAAFRLPLRLVARLLHSQPERVARKWAL